MKTTDSNIPSVGERGRTFGGEFEVVSRDEERVVIRWVDDGSVADFEPVVLQIVLDSYARAQDPDELEALREPDSGFADILGTLEEEAADTPCPNCKSPLNASVACDDCGTLECPSCAACDCMLVTLPDSAGRAPGRQ
jgi:hypothetical protein